MTTILNHFWQYYRDQPNNLIANVTNKPNFKLFKLKVKIKEGTPNDGYTKDVETPVPLELNAL